MMEAEVFRDRGDYYVNLTLAGEQVDVAGPFDDQLDAELASLRMAPREAFEYDGRSGREGSGWNHGTYPSKRERKLRGAA